MILRNPSNSLSRLRTAIGHTPRLRELIREGFDYEGFCHAIDAAALDPDQKRLAKALLDPNARLYHAARIVHQYQSVRSPYYTARLTELPSDHPLHASWKEAWLDVQAKFSARLESYNTSMNLNPVIQFYQNGYPNYLPRIVIEQRSDANASIGDYQGRLALFVHEGFFRLSPDALDGVLRHEAAHYFEPVRMGMSLRGAKASEDAMSSHTFKCWSRRKEYDADAMTVATGHGRNLATGLRQIKELDNSLRPAYHTYLRQSYLLAQTIAGIAREHGFQLKRGVKLPTGIFAPDTPHELLWESFVSAARLLYTAIRRGKSAEEYVKEVCRDPRTHPSDKKRIQKLCPNDWQEIIKPSSKSPARS